VYELEEEVWVEREVVDDMMACGGEFGGRKQKRRKS
jgi:hypothetical protein